MNINKGLNVNNSSTIWDKMLKVDISTIFSTGGIQWWGPFPNICKIYPLVTSQMTPNAQKGPNLNNSRIKWNKMLKVDISTIFWTGNSMVGSIPKYLQNSPPPPSPPLVTSQMTPNAPKGPNLNNSRRKWNKNVES